MTTHLRHRVYLLWIGVVVVFAGCEQQHAIQELRYSAEPPVSSRPVYRFSVHPLHNPQKLSQVYQPLMDRINAESTGFSVALDASRDYQAFEGKYAARRPDFLLPNPWQTLQAMRHGYQVIAMAGDARDFRGIFIVRKDSGIARPADLKGKVVSYPAHTALAAAVMPQYFLHTHGIRVNRDIQNVYAGSQESSIMHVYLGKSAAGATWPPPWALFQKDHPDEAAAMKVIWETAPLVNNAVMVRDDVPQPVRDGVLQALLRMDQTAEGRATLAGMATARFAAANDATYDVVARYIQRFENEVRPVQQP